MNNGLNSILELNNKLRKLTDQKRQGPKPKPKAKAGALKGHNVALSASGGNVHPPINDLRKKVAKPRSQSSNKHRPPVEEEDAVEDEFLNLSEETFENECNFVEQQLVDMELQINQAISNLKRPADDAEKATTTKATTKTTKKNAQQKSAKGAVTKKTVTKSSASKTGRL
jgi:alpha-galactosidase/6-phospho-beta-glucosidase family protein